ncbi:MAG: hypothetical protein ACJAVI_003157 [Candidatus Azotimanducaceae bacterium]|jgi:hypothetical protein
MPLEDYSTGRPFVENKPRETDLAAKHPRSPDAPDDSTRIKVRNDSESVEHPDALRIMGSQKFRLVRCKSTGDAYALLQDSGNCRALLIGSTEFRNLILVEHARHGTILKPAEITDIVDQLSAHALVEGQQVEIFYRVAPVEDGIELDIGDDSNTRILVKPGNVDVLSSGSSSFFKRTQVCSSLPLPAEKGDIGLFRKWLNLSDSDAVLLTAYITYTIAHPKVSSSKFPILVILGDQGTGKSFLVSNCILRLIDPTKLGLQVFPGNSKDLSIALNNTHVAAFDNMRNFNAKMSDFLCVASTGGNTSERKLYTNNELSLQPLHGAVIMNGIHSIVNHSDLAQRSLPIRTLPLSESNRRSETEILEEFNRELPIIYRGFLDQISKIFQQLDTAEVTHPERMIDFVKWLAAMEKVDNKAPGNYQSLYSAALHEAQLDTLLTNSLASAVLQFMQHTDQWSGTPTELLELLEHQVSQSTRYDRDWPRSPISLSKRLNSLKASLNGQKIDVNFHRGKERKITITNLEAY